MCQLNMLPILRHEPLTADVNCTTSPISGAIAFPRAFPFRLNEFLIPSFCFVFVGGDLPGSPEKDEGFINMLAGLMLEKSPEAAANTRPAENGDVDPPESPALAKHRWETYLQSRVRASRNMVQRSRPVSLGSALPKPTHSQMNPRTQSFCLGDKRSVERVAAEQAPAPPPLGKAEADGSDSANRTR